MSTKEPSKEDMAGVPAPDAAVPDTPALEVLGTPVPDGQTAEAPGAMAPDGQTAADQAPEAPVSDTPAPELTAAEARWVALMRRTMPEELRPMLLAPDWYQGMEEAEPQGRCMAWYDLVADRYVLLTVGAFYDGEQTVVGSMHCQCMYLQPDDRCCPSQRFQGSLEEQVARACDWLLWVAHRPVDRREWGGVTTEYRFADDGVGISASGCNALRRLPPRQVVRVPTRVL